MSSSKEGVVAEVGSGPPPRPADVALPDGVLAPGLVDLQINGYYGVEFQIPDEVSWASVAARLPETGATAFLPTMITAPVAELAAALRTAASFLPRLAARRRRRARAGRAPGGPVHRAGPQGRAQPGLDHRPDAGRDRGSDRAPAPASCGWSRSHPSDPVRWPPSTRWPPPACWSASGTATPSRSQVAAAVQAGARSVTHLFNAQRPLGHREPGVVGQALTDPRPDLRSHPRPAPRHRSLLRRSRSPPRRAGSRW